VVVNFFLLVHTFKLVRKPVHPCHCTKIYCCKSVKGKRFLRCKCRFLSSFCVSLQHSWTPKSHPISDLRFWSHANNPPLRAKIFCTCRNNTKNTNSIKDVDPFTTNAVETGLKPHFSQLADEIQLEQSQQMRWSLFLIILGVVQTSWAGRSTFINFSVTCAVSCRFLRCCSYMRIEQVNFLICTVNGCTIHDRDFRFNKSKNCLEKISGY